jgi:hypothetical protein
MAGVATFGLIMAWLLDRAPGEVVVLRPDSPTAPREGLPPAA